MKANITRLISIMLAVVMVVFTLASCKKKENVDDTSSIDSVVTSNVGAIGEEYFTVNEEDGTSVELVADEEGNSYFDVVEGTTLEKFLQDVVPVDGYAIKVFAADGTTEVTDTAAKIEDGMILKVYLKATEEGEEDTEVASYDIKVVSQEDFDQAKQNRVSASNGKNANNSKNGGTTSSLTNYSFVLGSKEASKYTENSTIGSVYKTQIEKIKSKYSCSVEYKTYQNDPNEIVNEVMAGTCNADIIELSLECLRNVAKQGCALDLASYSLGKAYTNGFTESCTYSGKKYAVAFPAMGATPMGIIYNKDLIKQYNGGKDVVATAYKDGSWTFDKFREIAKNCTDEANDVSGVTSNTNIIGMAITSEAGGTATRDSSGKIVATMCNQNGVKALEFMRELKQTDKSYRYNNDITTSINDFIAGKAAMFASNLTYYPDISKSATFEFGFVLFPKGPDQSNYISGAYDGNGFIVPKNKESTANVSVTFLNQLANVNGKIINAKSEEMQRNGFDKNSVAAYKYAVNNASPEYRTGAIDANVSSSVDTSVLSKSENPSTVIDQVKGQLQSQLDKFYSGNLA